MMRHGDHDQGEDERRNHDTAAAVDRCAEVSALGAACDEPADMRCPTCRRALCYACAEQHCQRDAPSCRATASPRALH